ncbi:MAG: flagellar basal-body MS-ring/collar protein FliF [Bacillota bacterium]
MAEFFQKIKDKVLGLIDGLDKKKKVIIISLSLFFVIGVSALILVLSNPEYVPLAQGLDVNEAAEIDSKLTELEIPHKAEGTSAILVPKDQLSKAKMSLAIEGVYNKKDFSWTDALNQSSITMTSEEKSEMYLLAKATALAQAIESIENIERAVVNLHVPDDSSFLFNEDVQSRVGCTIKTKNGAELSKAQVNGIQMLLLNSVQGLNKEYISIIDSSSGKELTNSSNSSETYQANSQYELKTEIETRLKDNITSFLENIYGRDNVKVAPSVVLDFDSKETVSTVFEPPNEDENEGLVRSISEASENVKDGQTGGAPGTDSNGANTQYNESVDSESDYESSSRSLNYELNQINTKVQKAEGTISEISLAVIVNTKVLKDEILTEENQEQIKNLVSASAGLNTKVVEVSALEFADKAAGFDKISSTDESSSFNLILIGGILLSFIAIISIVVVFMRKRAKVREVELEEKVEKQQEELDEITTQEDDESSPKFQINKFIDKNPEAVAQLLRSWANEE